VRTGADSCASSQGPVPAASGSDRLPKDRARRHPRRRGHLGTLRGPAPRARDLLQKACPNVVAEPSGQVRAKNIAAPDEPFPVVEAIVIRRGGMSDLDLPGTVTVCAHK